VLADPHDYPQFAQQRLDAAIPIAFITAKTVKQRLADGTPQLLVDVRKRASYDAAHLPGAVSIPLQELPSRMADIPRDVPVVLY
jgi:rhodanese-related sulfurtransferase